MNCCRETAKRGTRLRDGAARSERELDGCATLQPQGVGSEAYLNGTSQGPTPEDGQEGHPHPWSQQVIHEISGLALLQSY